LKIELLFFQSNHEGDIVDFIQENLYLLDGVVINPAAFTKGGYSILDALTAIELPFVEVHLSNIVARGGWHAETIFAPKALGHINGFKGYVYNLGLQAIYNYLNRK
jgi:3-dehydroquinate dehydratase-2